ncbi:MAG: hypothetical protein RI894_1205 [Bacteroidota bacterium]|jgi:hypothetical protein
MPNIDKILRNLVADIKTQQCVLLIGPEIVQLGGKSLSRHLYHKLAAENGDDIAYYYEQHGLFLFNEGGKEEIQREIRLFYERNEAVAALDKSIYKKIVEMPFHLVVSINPDSFLSDAAFAQQQQHRFAYFQNEGIAVEEVEQPLKETPLFYNLCGSIAKDASLILDYDDLFRLMKAAFASPSLPLKLAIALNEAKTFICIGFDFEKWYTQLLLQLLSGNKGKRIKKYAIDTSIANEHTQTFLFDQFGIKFLGEEAAFFEHLYQEIKAEGLLRSLPTLASSKQVPLQQLIAANKVAEALDYLHVNLTDEDDLHAVILLKSRQSNKEAVKHKGTIDIRDYNIEHNRIIDAILALSKAL